MRLQTRWEPNTRNPGRNSGSNSNLDVRGPRSDVVDSNPYDGELPAVRISQKSNFQRAMPLTEHRVRDSNLVDSHLKVYETRVVPGVVHLADPAPSGSEYPLEGLIDAGERARVPVP
jgi:hypothetical protein